MVSDQLPGAWHRLDARSSVGIIAALVWRPHVAELPRPGGGRRHHDISLARLNRRLLDDSAELICLAPDYQRLCFVAKH